MAYVQDQTFQATGVNSGTVALTSVGANNFLALTAAIFEGGEPANTAPTDTQSNTWNTTTAPTSQNSGNAFIFYAENVSSGNTTVTYDFGTGFYANGSLVEFSGMETSSSIDVQTSNSNAGSTTPTSGTTGTTAQADEVVLECVAVSSASSDVGLDVPATTGYTNLHVEQNSNSFMAGASGYKIVSATGTQSAAWGTLSGSEPWSAKIVTFKEAAGGGGLSIPVAMGSYRRRHQPWGR